MLTASYVDGTVTVYRNADVVATVPLRAADVKFLASKNGKAGSWTSQATGSMLDDFRAATVAR